MNTEQSFTISDVAFRPLRHRVEYVGLTQCLKCSAPTAHGETVCEEDELHPMQHAALDSIDELAYSAKGIVTVVRHVHACLTCGWRRVEHSARVVIDCGGVELQRDYALYIPVDAPVCAA